MKRRVVVVAMLMLAVGLGCNYSERKASNEIVARVEQYKKSTGHLPDALSDIGLKENESCPCYCKTSKDSYIVWYGTTLGESDTFNSRTMNWSEASGPACAK
jgi:hypothetical protein